MPNMPSKSQSLQNEDTLPFCLKHGHKKQYSIYLLPLTHVGRIDE
jgi:hypothetical protein